MRNIDISIVLLIIFFLVMRGHMELCVWSAYPTKHGYRKYRKQTSFLNRFFLIDFRKNAKDHRVKYTRKTIRYSLIAEILFVVNLIDFLTLAVTMVFYFLNFFNLISPEAVDIPYLFMLFLIILTFFVDFEIARYENSKHKRG